MLCAIGASYLVLGQSAPIGWSKLSNGGTQSGRSRASGAAEELVAFILGGFSAPINVSTAERSRRKVAAKGPRAK